MRKKEQIDDDLDVDSDDDNSLSEDTINVSTTSRQGAMNPLARRRLEEYRERRALEDLLRDDFDSYMVG